MMVVTRTQTVLFPSNNQEFFPCENVYTILKCVVQSNSHNHTTIANVYLWKITIILNGNSVPIRHEAFASSSLLGNSLEATTLDASCEWRLVAFTINNLCFSSLVARRRCSYGELCFLSKAERCSTILFIYQRVLGWRTASSFCEWLCVTISLWDPSTLRGIT